MTIPMMLTLLLLLQVKHYTFDYQWQTPAMLTGKAILGNIHGINHAALHGLGTFVVIAVLTGHVPYAVALGAGDAVIHYIVDYTKAHYGTHDTASARFWRQFGLDQFAHQSTYLAIALMTAVILY